MSRIVLGCILALCGVVGLELRGAPDLAGIEAADASAQPTMIWPQRAAEPDARVVAGLADAILARPLFSPKRRPDAAAHAVVHVPRLTGLLLSPHLQLALLQTSDEAGARSQITTKGGEVAGWDLVALNDRGVLLRRGTQSVHLTLQPATAGPMLPIPIDKIVIMPTKRTNPQLAW